MKGRKVNGIEKGDVRKDNKERERMREERTEWIERGENGEEKSKEWKRGRRTFMCLCIDLFMENKTAKKSEKIFSDNFPVEVKNNIFRFWSRLLDFLLHLVILIVLQFIDFLESKSMKTNIWWKETEWREKGGEVIDIHIVWHEACIKSGRDDGWESQRRERERGEFIEREEREWIKDWKSQEKNHWSIPRSQDSQFTFSFSYNFVPSLSLYSSLIFSLSSLPHRLSSLPLYRKCI